MADIIRHERKGRERELGGDEPKTGYAALVGHQAPEGPESPGYGHAEATEREAERDNSCDGLGDMIGSDGSRPPARCMRTRGEPVYDCGAPRDLWCVLFVGRLGLDGGQVGSWGLGKQAQRRSSGPRLSIIIG